MSPLRDAVRLVDGVERNLKRLEEGDIVFLIQRLGGHIQQLGASAAHVVHHLYHGRLVQRRVEVVCQCGLVAQRVHRVYLVLHQGDEGRHHDGGALHQQRW